MIYISVLLQDAVDEEMLHPPVNCFPQTGHLYNCLPTFLPFFFVILL